MVVQNQYTLRDAIQSAIASRLSCLRTAIPGIIQSYDGSLQKASVAASFYSRNSSGALVDPMVISSVPVFVLSGGGAALTMPIQAGDPCLIIFSERSLDSWKFSNGQLVPPSGENQAGFSTHNMCDAIALVGVAPFDTCIPSTPDTVSLEYGASKLALTQSKVAIGSGATEVLSEVASALTAISVWMEASSVVPVLCPVPLATTVSGAATAISSIAGSL